MIKPLIDLAERFGYTLVEKDDLVNDCAVAGDEIFVGKYEDPELLLISFFHEHGHRLVLMSYKKIVHYNRLLIELEAWHLGLKTAAALGYFFTDEAIQWAYNKALTYVGHDEREVMGWDKSVRPKLWKYRMES